MSVITCLQLCVLLLKCPTRVTSNSESLIDHIYVNKENKISQSGVIKTGLSDHFITFCTRKTIRESIGKHKTVKIRVMKNYSRDAFLNKLRTIDWSIVTYIKDDVNLALEKFNTLLMLAIDFVAPERIIRIKGRTESWINTEILEAMWDRDKALLKANRNKSNTNLRKHFNNKRNKVVNLTKRSKTKYFSNKIEENKNNTKKLWDQFKSLGYSNECKENSNIVLNIEKQKCHDNVRIVEEFNKYFLTIASTLVKKLPIINKIFDVDSISFSDYYKSKGISPKTFKLTTVSEDFIFNQLKSINPSKSTGIDEIRPIFLRDGADVLKGAILHIVNLSIESNTIPEIFKYAIVKPLH